MLACTIAIAPSGEATPAFLVPRITVLQRPLQILGLALALIPETGYIPTALPCAVLSGGKPREQGRGGQETQLYKVVLAKSDR